MIGRRGSPSTGEVDKPKGFDGFELRLGDVMRGERATLSKSLLDVQRELRIKASYIAAIENCDATAFETPGFVSGYVRSYARYLGMDAEWAFARFCAESGFAPAHGLNPAASGPKAAPQPKKMGGEQGDPLANPNALFVPRSRPAFTHIEPGAIGSVLVLMALVAAIGYGGWSVLQEVQKVRLTPVDQSPDIVADLDPVSSAPAPQGDEDSSKTALNLPKPDALDRLYRPETLDAPVMVPRDGPIAAIDPSKAGAFAGFQPQQLAANQSQDGSADGTQGQGINAALAEAMGQQPAAGAEASGDQQNGVRTVAQADPGVELVAVRPSWVRVSAADGTVLFEKILDAGERYKVPQMEEAPKLRAGNSGSLYFAVDGKTYGPAAHGASVVKNVALSAESLRDSYQLADLSQDPALAKAVAVAELDSSKQQPGQ